MLHTVCKDGRQSLNTNEAQRKAVRTRCEQLSRDLGQKSIRRIVSSYHPVRGSPLLGYGISKVQSSPSVAFTNPTLIRYPYLLSRCCVRTENVPTSRYRTVATVTTRPRSTLLIWEEIVTLSSMDIICHELTEDWPFFFSQPAGHWVQSSLETQRVEGQAYLSHRQLRDGLHR